MVAYSATYDVAHRPDTITDSRGPLLNYDFSPGGLLKSVRDGHGNQTNYLYDAANRLTGIWAPNYGTIAYRYDAGGRLVEKWLPNGISSRYTYNTDDSLKQLINRKSAASIISRHIYGYNGFGNRTSQAEYINGTTINWTYAYDGLNRLVQAANGTPAQQENYTYDPLGNRTSRTVNATTPSTSVSIYDAANQLLEVRNGSATGSLLQAFVYDAIGNLAKKAEGGTVTRTAKNCTGNTVTTLGYDALNQLIRVAKTGLPTEKYVYDDSGRRVRKVVGSTTTDFLYQGPNVYAEYGSSFTTPAALYTHGPGSDDPILRQTGMGPTATAKYYHQDGLGSVVALSTQTGTTAASQRFDAWGNKTASSGTVPQYGYTGREPDATGFVYYRARYYDPSMGRFTQRDPSGFGGGINAYAYVNGNPINFNDPQGLVAQQAGEWWQESGKGYALDFAQASLQSTIDLGHTTAQVLLSPISLVNSVISPDDQIGLLMSMGPIGGAAAELDRSLIALEELATTARGVNVAEKIGVASLASKGTPGGRTLTDHALQRMTNPPKGRAPMTPSEVDEVLDTANRIKKVSAHPKSDTITVQSTTMPGKPQVVVDAETGNRVITVIKNKPK